MPILRATLDGLDAFRQRMAFRLSLEPPNEAETALYIDFRLKKAGVTRRIFTEDAIRAIYKETGGNPRNVNKICDICLYEGERRKAQEVSASLVRVAAALA
jgi:type II secretory pathway predicted ATPase ExeA